MNRTIKFRAWDKVNKTMCYEITRLDFKAGLRNGDNLAFDENGQQIAEFELMQFTGLLDKKSVEIYEGDIVRKYNEVDESYGYKDYIVTWNKARAAFQLEGKDNWGGYLLYKTREKLEIIGNQIEHPHLLNQS